MKFFQVIYIISICNLLNINVHAQSMILNKTKIKLNNQTVELFEMSASHSKIEREFYCLPINLRLSVNEECQPEFLFMSYRKEGSQEVEVIMHWLLKMGLEEFQNLLIDSMLKVQVDSNARFAGQVTVEAIGKMQFKNKGGNSELLEIIISGITSGGHVPVLSNTKSATAFKYIGTSAEIMVACINNPKKLSGLFIEMKYQLKSIGSSHNFNNESNSSQLSLLFELEKLFEKAKTCNGCIILSN